MRRPFFTIVEAVLQHLDKFNILIPDAPAVADMAESAPTIPEAQYNLRIHKAEYVAVPKTKEAKGPYIKVQFVVTGPGEKFVGRMIFQNYTLTGDGTFRLRELLTMTGHDASFRLEDSDQLVGLELGASVIIKPGTQGYSDKNEVRKHLPLIGMGQPATV